MEGVPEGRASPGTLQALQQQLTDTLRRGETEASEALMTAAGELERGLATSVRVATSELDELAVLDVWRTLLMATGLMYPMAYPASRR